MNLEEVHKELRRAVDTGKVVYGSETALKNALHGKAQAIVCAKNLPENTKSKLKRSAELSKIPFVESTRNGLELGEVCGKPFNVGAATVLDAGRSKLLEAINA